MKPAMPAPMNTRASRTLTAAMIPSRRFVVPSSLPMSPSERRRLMRARVPRRLMAAFAERIVQELPALVGHTGGFLHRRAEAHELAREVVERGLDLPPQAAAVLCEKQIPGDAADHGAHDCC